MNLEDTYRKILEICKDNYIEEPYIVGGVPRSLYLKSLDEKASFVDRGLSPPEEYKDIDITTNNSDTTRLGITTAYELGEGYKFFKDGHVSVYADKIIFDFSSNFISDKVVDYITKELFVEDKKLFEVYSRDFTINTLHKRLLDNDLLDLTNQGKEDLNNKIIRTPVPAEITLSDDLRRIYRAVNFAARFGFNIHEDIIDYGRRNKEKFTGENKWVLKDAFITSIIGESIDSDGDVTIHYLSEMNLLSTVPLVGRFKEELIKRRLVNKYLDDAINLTEYSLKN